MNPKVLCFVCKIMLYIGEFFSLIFFIGWFSNNLEEFALGSSLLPSDWSLPHLPLSSHHDQFYTSPRWLTDVSGQELVILTDNESWIITAQSLASDLPGFTSWLCHLLAESLQPSQLTSPYLKIGTLIAVAPEGYREDQMRTIHIKCLELYCSHNWSTSHGTNF